MRLARRTLYAPAVRRYRQVFCNPACRRTLRQSRPLRELAELAAGRLTACQIKKGFAAVCALPLAVILPATVLFSIASRPPSASRTSR